MNDYNLAVGFTNSIVNLSGYINNQPWGTNLVAGLREAVNIISNDPRSRRDDNSVRKLVFLLTDGQGTAAHEHAKYPEFTERLKNVVSRSHFFSQLSCQNLQHYFRMTILKTAFLIKNTAKKVLKKKLHLMAITIASLKCWGY